MGFEDKSNFEANGIILNEADFDSDAPSLSWHMGKNNLWGGYAYINANKGFSYTYSEAVNKYILINAVFEDGRKRDP